MRINKFSINGLRRVHVSSNVNEAIKTSSNFFFFFFTRRFSHARKEHKTHISEQKQKRQHFYVHEKHLRGGKSLVCLFASLWFLCFLCFFVCLKFSRKKKKQKKFKIVLMVSFTLLLLLLYKMTTCLRRPATTFFISQKKKTCLKQSLQNIA